MKKNLMKLALCLLLALTASPAAAQNVGLAVKPTSLANGQNVLWGVDPNSSFVAGANLLLLQRPAGSTKFSIDGNGNTTIAGTLSVTGTITGTVTNADTVDNLHVTSGGRNNEANRVVKTDANGYIQAGYINSTNGDENNASNPARVWGTNGSDSYMRTYQTGSLSVNYANSAGNASTVGGLGSGSFLRANAQSPAGNAELATSDNGSYSYSVAALELRETNFGGTSGYLPPRLAFHWGGVVASQLTIESDGKIAVVNNPGTGYENFRANNYYLNNRGFWLSDALNQYVKTSDSPTFENIYSNDWFRNNAAGEGLYNQATAKHFYSQDANYWKMNSNRGLQLYDNDNCGASGAPCGYLYYDDSGNFGLLPPDGSWQVRAWNSGVELYDTTYANTIYDYDGLTHRDSVSVDRNFGMFFSSDRSTAYAIYRESGAWSNPFPDLRIGFHTGIKLGANSGYNGIRFYNDYDMSGLVMSVNDGSTSGANNVYVANRLGVGTGPSGTSGLYVVPPDGSGAISTYSDATDRGGITSTCNNGSYTCGWFSHQGGGTSVYGISGGGNGGRFECNSGSGTGCAGVRGSGWIGVYSTGAWGYDFYADSNRPNYFSGSAGFGTTNIPAKVTVNGGISVGEGNAINGTYGSQRTLQIATQNGINGGTYDAHTGALIWSTLESGGWGDARLKIALGTNWGAYNTGSPAFELSQAGIGLGTANPSARIHVASTGSAGSGARIKFGDGDYVYLEETTDDVLTIKGSTININAFAINVDRPLTYGYQDVNLGSSGTYSLCGASEGIIRAYASCSMCTLFELPNWGCENPGTVIRIYNGGAYGNNFNVSFSHDEGVNIRTLSVGRGVTAMYTIDGWVMVE